MGIDATMIGLMRRFGIRGKGASFGYPDLVDMKTRTRTRSESVFADLGVDVPDVYDVGPLEGRTINILDLNEPLPSVLIERYDFTINPGTFESVFNIGQAVRNVYMMTRVDGLGFHHGSVGRPRLGYWNLTLNTWKEFCAVNGEMLHFQEDGRIYYAVTRKTSSAFAWPQENNVR